MCSKTRKFKGGHGSRNASLFFVYALITNKYLEFLNTLYLLILKYIPKAADLALVV